MKIFRLFAILAMASAAWCGQVTGKLVAPTSGPVAGAIITFKPSQSAIVTGSYSIVPSTATCYTTTDGTIVGIPDPAVQPVVNTNTASGSLAAGTYYVVISYYSSVYETYYSPETTVVLSAPGSLIITAPILQPTNATAYKVYIGTSSGTETLQSTQVGWTNYTRSTALSAGTALPSSNTSLCTLIFGDTMIPALVTYYTNVVDAQGSQLPGFPQNYYLLGSTADFSSLIPASNLSARFPYAIVANPSGNAQQSINSPLTLNGYKMTAGEFAASVNDGTTQPIQVVSTLPIDNLTVKRLNSTTTVNTTNNWTLTWNNPAAARAATVPDPGANGWNLFWTPTAGAVDCTQAWIVCTESWHLRWNAATCNGTTAITEFSTFATNAPTPTCTTGTQLAQGLLTFKAAINLEKTTSGNNAAGAGTVVTSAWASNTTAGNLFIVTVAWVNNAAQTITGVANGGADTFTLVKTCANGAAITSAMYYAKNITGGSTTAITATFSAAAVGAIQAHEYSGADTAAPLDVSVCSSGSSSTPSSGASGALAGTPELLIAGLATASTGTNSFVPTNLGATGHSGVGASGGAAIVSAGAILQASTAQTMNFSLQNSRVWAMAMGAFKTAGTTLAASAQRPVDMTTDWAGPINVRQIWYGGSITLAGPTFSPISTTGVVLSSALSCVPITGIIAGESAFNTATSTTSTMQASSPDTWIVTTNSGLDLTGCSAGTDYMMQMKFARERTSVGDTFDGPVNVVTYDVSHMRNQ